MNNQDFQQLLSDQGACHEAVRFVGEQPLQQAWEGSERADWMLWLVGRMADKPGWPTRQQVVLAACACAETSLKFVKAGEERPKKTLETARKWARGEASLAEVRKAARESWVADAAATDAAATDAYAAATDAAATDAYAAATYAAYAAADAATDAAYAAVRLTALREMAGLVRELIPVPYQGGEEKQQ